MREYFERKLNYLNESIIEMGNMVNTAITSSVTSLIDKDEDLAEKVIEGDSYINMKDKEVERLCIDLLLKEQPVASDLRFVTSVYKMTTDLERIGDKAYDIAVSVKQMIKKGYKKSELGSVLKLAKLANEMLALAVKSFVEGSMELAEEAFKMDDNIDLLFEDVRKEVIYEMKNGDPSPTFITDVLLVAKYLERIGDHAQNIAETVYFSLTAEEIVEE